MKKQSIISNVAEIKVQFLPSFKPSERPTIKESTHAYSVLKTQWDEGLMQFLEEFKVILLNNANHVLGVVDIAMGGKDSVMVDLRIIFSIALTASASKIIMAHNHPSGRLSPSGHDRALTKKAIEAGKLLDIEVCDHIILTAESYYSMRDNGDM
ncbi:JAB domain-containing protein [Sphingobacterium deserti]|uniref:DNA repair protein RadC n=1 Tax=Sphingobacterium deserti TaxID=1229276 RepID=A0A0B8T5R8_9SPHI|nr:JAB domain-containing protein [Sphingobacterium deserti]KGE16073.1 DNA repair protein RadC [Sphingobacterium deserti]